MPRESTILVLIFTVIAAVLWTVLATLWSVDRVLPAVSTFDGLVIRLLIWPTYLVWGAATLLVQWGIGPSSIWLLMLLVGGVIGGVLSLLTLQWASRS